MVFDFQESLILRIIFIENQIEFLNKSKYVWRYSCVECVEAVMMTIGAGITANEASPGPSKNGQVDGQKRDFHKCFSRKPIRIFEKFQRSHREKVYRVRRTNTNVRRSREGGKRCCQS